MVVVAEASAAKVVIPSKQLPGPSPYMGRKWSNPHAPSKPRASPKRTRVDDLAELHPLLSHVDTESHGATIPATGSAGPGRRRPRRGPAPECYGPVAG